MYDVLQLLKFELETQSIIIRIVAEFICIIYRLPIYFWSMYYFYIIDSTSSNIFLDFWVQRGKGEDKWQSGVSQHFDSGVVFHMQDLVLLCYIFSTSAFL